MVLLKLDAEKGEGVDIARSYNVRGYPSFILTNASGETYDRWMGYGEPEPFIETMAGATADPITVNDRLARFRKERNAPDAMKIGELRGYEGMNGEALAWYERAHQLDVRRSGERGDRGAAHPPARPVHRDTQRTAREWPLRRLCVAHAPGLPGLPDDDAANVATACSCSRVSTLPGRRVRTWRIASAADMPCVVSHAETTVPVRPSPAAQCTATAPPAAFVSSMKRTAAASCSGVGG